MHWKSKARIQNAIARLPASVSYAVYYWMQRHFGGLRDAGPLSRMAAGVESWRRLTNQGVDPTGKVFFEVGTGREPLVPMCYWLMGAGRTITIDLNPYLKDELVRETLADLSRDRDKVRRLFGSLLNEERFDDLLTFIDHQRYATPAFLDLCRIDYIAPGDATRTGLADGSVDFHTSYNTFEHIPPDVLRDILAEGNRIVADDGLFVHRIDYSDHFSHSDDSISSVNFLRYSDDEWQRWAGNRYMYMNRLRHDDFLDMFEEARHAVVESEPVLDPEALAVLRSGQLPLYDRFAGKPTDTLAIASSWLVSRKLATGSVPA